MDFADFTIRRLSCDDDLDLLLVEMMILTSLSGTMRLII